MTDYDDLRIWEKRREANRRAGINQTNTRGGFTKTALNSIHKYLTGEFIVKPGLVYALSVAPKRDEMREKVAVAVVDRLGGDCEIEAWFDRFDYLNMEDTQFKTNELTELLEAMDDAKESRDLGEIQNIDDLD